ncbi:hypothetical protein [Salinarimonas chemoclinalis]|uniref:hypothetical protein n=1 Tax=Salinarimonas chemoclinalis TaxID=3241599 RepID=UPI0035565591
MADNGQTWRFEFVVYAAKRWPLVIGLPFLVGIALLVAAPRGSAPTQHIATVDLAMTETQRERAAVVLGGLAKRMNGRDVTLEESGAFVRLAASAGEAGAAERAIDDAVEAIRSDEPSWREWQLLEAELARVRERRATVGELLGRVSGRAQSIRDESLDGVADFTVSTIQLLRFAEELDAAASAIVARIEALPEDLVVSEIRVTSFAPVRPAARYVAFTGAVGTLALVLLVLWLRFEKSRGGDFWRGRLAPLLATLRARPTFKP